MKKTLLATAAVLSLALAAPARAQDADTAPQDGAAAPAKPMAGHHRRHHMKSGEAGQGDIRPGHEPGVGDSEPFSSKASNIDHADSRSGIAPRLPTPMQGADGTTKQYLHDAAHDLDKRRTGAAQEALERAETRRLSRVSQMGGNPAQDPVIMCLNQARKALAAGHADEAKSAVEQAMNAMAQDMKAAAPVTSSPATPSMPMGGGQAASPMNGMGTGSAPAPAMAPNGMTNQPAAGVAPTAPASQH